MNFTNEQIRYIAMKQSAIDIGCRVEDFTKTEPVIVDGVIGQGARVYYREPIGCNFVTYGNNVVASVKPELRKIADEYVHSSTFYYIMSTPDILRLTDQIAPLNYAIRHMAYYFLPDVNKVRRLSCTYELRLLYPEDFSELYLPEWSNAICEKRRELDMMAYGAYDGGKLVGLAGCSADCEGMWQIGIDVLPEYRNRGIAAALTSNLAVEVLERGKVPFYCCAWANIPSAKNAIKSGFTPAWMEMTVKPKDIE